MSLPKSLVLLVVFISAQESNGRFTTVINVPPDVAPESIGSGTQLNLMDGGVLPGLVQAGSPDGTSQNVELNISGGDAGLLDVYAGATLNMSGGTIGDFIAYEGATVNISGGTISQAGGTAQPGSTVNISGGIFPGPFAFQEATNVTLSGGAFGQVATSDNVLTLIGNDFLLDGTPPVESSLFTAGTITGVFDDGLPFIVRHSGAVEFQYVPVPPIDTNSIFVDTDAAPHGVRSGQQITVVEGGKLPGPFTAVGATVSLLGGEAVSIGAADSELNISGGSIEDLSASSESQIDIAGGSIDLLTTFDSRIVMKSGEVGTVQLFGRSSMLLSGGRVGNSGRADFNISGRSELEVVGTHFLLDGLPIPGLDSPGDTVILESRGGAGLTGSLADDTDFRLRLRQEFIDPNATLRITLIPEPSSVSLASAALVAAMVRRNLVQPWSTRTDSVAIFD